MRVCEWVCGALTSTVVGDALIHLPRKVNNPMAALVKSELLTPLQYICYFIFEYIMYLILIHHLTS